MTTNINITIRFTINGKDICLKPSIEVEQEEEPAKKKNEPETSQASKDYQSVNSFTGGNGGKGKRPPYYIRGICSDGVRSDEEGFLSPFSP